MGILAHPTSCILEIGDGIHNGFVFQIIGDAFCAVFHTVGDAIQAAVNSQTNLYNEDWGDTPIKVRMGIHTGKAEVQENEEYHGVWYKNYIRSFK